MKKVNSGISRKNAGKQGQGSFREVTMFIGGVVK